MSATAWAQRPAVWRHIHKTATIPILNLGKVCWLPQSMITFTTGKPFPLRSFTAPRLPSVWYRARCCCSGWHRICKCVLLSLLIPGNCEAKETPADRLFTMAWGRPDVRGTAAGAVSAWPTASPDFGANLTQNMTYEFRIPCYNTVHKHTNEQFIFRYTAVFSCRNYVVLDRYKTIIKAN